MIFAFGEIIKGNWGSQYHTGTHDIICEPVGNHEDGDSSVEMKHGPKDTHVFDREGFLGHLVRIQNGTRLFGVYQVSKVTRARLVIEVEVEHMAKLSAARVLTLLEAVPVEIDVSPTFYRERSKIDCKAVVLCYYSSRHTDQGGSP